MKKNDELMVLLIEVISTIHGEGILYSFNANQEKVMLLIEKYKQDIIKYVTDVDSGENWIIDYLKKW
jgi:hypothetical protein